MIMYFFLSHTFLAQARSFLYKPIFSRVARREQDTRRRRRCKVVEGKGSSSTIIPSVGHFYPEADTEKKGSTNCTYIHFAPFSKVHSFSNEDNEVKRLYIKV